MATFRLRQRRDPAADAEAELLAVEALAPRPEPNPFRPEADHERLRSAARDHGASLVRRHADDIVGRQLHYADRVEPLAEQRLAALGERRTEFLGEAEGRLAGAREALVRADRAVNEVIESAEAAGIKLAQVRGFDDEAPDRAAANTARVFGGALAAGALALGLTGDLAAAALVAAGGGLLGWGIQGPVADLPPAVLAWRAATAATAVRDREAKLAELWTRRVETVKQRANDLARGEVALAKELVALYREGV